MKNPNSPVTAFPAGESCFDSPATPGMTLRDYFAGQAVGHAIQLLDNQNDNREETLNAEELVEYTAILSYSLADAMLLEREKNEDPI